jgi:cyclopropane fatty-acyl-phospholipid synthase-like methyltransferase
MLLDRVEGLRVLDAGCGEGKSAFFMAERGAIVDAIDVSDLALRNARAAWPNLPNLRWRREDVREFSAEEPYDIVIAYGLLHCLHNVDQVLTALGNLKARTSAGGHVVLCAFNNRCQDLRGHPGFSPTLLPHRTYVGEFADWTLVESSDADLLEQHPHNQIPHSHSLTRILARCPVRR